MKSPRLNTPSADMRCFALARAIRAPAVINAMIAADTMTGIDGHTVQGLPAAALQEVLGKYQRIK